MAIALFSSLVYVLPENQAIGGARSFFESALALNEKGVGALSGMLWCAVVEKNRETALEYALAKVRVKDTDPAAARAWVEKNCHNSRKNSCRPDEKPAV